MKKNLYEIFEEFESAPTKDEKLAVLRNNNRHDLVGVLQMTFDPRIQFVIEKAPKFKPDDSPPGLGYSSIHQELQRIYLLVKDHPRAPATLTQQRREQIFIQMLEALEAKEANILLGMVLKKLPVKGLTPKIVKEVYPDIIPD